MATLTVTQLTTTAAAPGFVAADDAGDQFLVDGDTVLHVRNDNAAEVTVTLTSQVSDEIGVIADDLEFAVPATTDRCVYLGSYSRRFRDSDGYCQVTYDETDDVTVAVYRT
jgi:hypothetical protein